MPIGTGSIPLTTILLGATGSLGWGPVASAICSWIPGNCVVVPTLGSPPLTAAGAVVSGKGGFTFSAASGFGTALANAAATSGVGDAAAVAKWTVVAQAIIDWWKNHGSINPASLACNPSGGPVVGTASVSFDSLAAGPAMAASIGIPPLGAVAWAGFGAGLFTFFQSNALIIPGAMTSPSGGGPVTGAGVVT